MMHSSSYSLTKSIVLVNTFTVMSYNVNWGFAIHGRASKMSRKVMEAIRTSGADIVFLQETHEGWETVLRDYLHKEYPNQFYCHHECSICNDQGQKIKNSFAGGSAVLAKSHILVEPLTQIQPDVKGSFFPAQFIRFSRQNTEIAVNDDLCDDFVYAINVHLRPPINDLHEPSLKAIWQTSSIRLKEIKNLYFKLHEIMVEKKSEKRRILIVGDFNEGNSGSALTWLLNSHVVSISSKSSLESSITKTTTTTTTTTPSFSIKNLWNISSKSENQCDTSSTHSLGAHLSDVNQKGLPPQSSLPNVIDKCEKYDTFQDALLDYCANATTWVWPVAFGFKLKGTYDHIVFSNRYLKALSCNVLDEYESASDHLPVVSKIEIL